LLLKKRRNQSNFCITRKRRDETSKIVEMGEKKVIEKISLNNKKMQNPTGKLQNIESSCRWKLCF